MLDSLEIKNIPISISILHEQEYHNLCKMLYRVNKQRRRRAFTDVRDQLHSFGKHSSFGKTALTTAIGPSIANIQMFHWEVDV